MNLVQKSVQHGGKLAPLVIEHHLQEPLNWYPIESLKKWVSEHYKSWVVGGWKESNLRTTTDVGMVWVR